MRRLTRVTGALPAFVALAACGTPPVEPLDEGEALASIQVSAVLTEEPRCAGAPATLWPGMPVEAIPEGAVIMQGQQGTGFEVRGTSGRDVIVGSDGADRLRGQQGNDLICAEDGDQVWGGPGNDHVHATGTVRARGGEGNDQLVGGTGAQRLHGGPGNDLLRGREDDDVLLGGPDDDILSGGSGSDFFGGCDGRDVAQDFDLLLDVFNGTVEIGVPEGATYGEPPHDEGGCEDGDDGCEDGQDGGCEGGHDDG